MRKLLPFLLSFFLFFVGVNPVLAFDTSKLGVHILSVHELDDAKKLLVPMVLGDSTQAVLEDTQEWRYVTIPLTLNDLTPAKKQEWQTFFHQAKKLKIKPIIRLSTSYSPETQSWLIPNKKQIVDQITFLSSLEWPVSQLPIIAYNEVNHAKEWGGHLDPAGYAKVLHFVSDWAHTEKKEYLVLPAAMDLSAPNSRETREAFVYLNQMYQADPAVFSYIDMWNSHSYPNPGFSSSPTRTGKKSLRGFQNELAFLKAKTGHDYQVMITETGWRESPGLERWLESYYTYAMQHIWSDARVVAVTPFLLKGAPGPFAAFSFYDDANQPTNQFYSLRGALKNLAN